MSAITLRSARFPAGTSVGAYLRSAWGGPSTSNPEGAPSGAAVETAVVGADNSLTFTTLTDGTRYFAHANVGGANVIVSFTPGQATPARAASYGPGDWANKVPLWNAAAGRWDPVASSGGVATALAAAANAWLPPGAITANMDRHDIESASTITSGTMRLCGGMLALAGKTVTGIGMAAAAAVVTPSNQWFCIVDRATRNVLATTVDDLTAAWAANAPKTLLLATAIGGSTPGGTWTPSVDTLVYIGVVQVAATPATLAASPVSTAAAIIAPVLVGNSTAGLTGPASAPATVAAPSASGICPFAWVF